MRRLETLILVVQLIWLTTTNTEPSPKGFCRVSVIRDDESGKFKTIRNGPGCNTEGATEDVYTELKQNVQRRKKNLECPQTKFKFSGNQITEWIHVMVAIPEITSGTVCSWLTPLSRSNVDGSYFNYVTQNQDNEFLLFFHEDQLRVHFHGEQVGQAFNISSKTHLCVVAQPTLGSAMIFLNGSFQTKLAFTTNRPIQGGGALILGQEQDSLLGSFDASQAFNGTIENFMMWYRVLTDVEIEKLYNDRCSCPKDHAISLKPDQIDVKGNVKRMPVDECY